MTDDEKKYIYYCKRKENGNARNGEKERKLKGREEVEREKEVVCEKSGRCEETGTVYGKRRI